jgi:hypothetical protein
MMSLAKRDRRIAKLEAQVEMPLALLGMFKSCGASSTKCERNLPACANSMPPRAASATPTQR